MPRCGSGFSPGPRDRPPRRSPGSGGTSAAGVPDPGTRGCVGGELHADAEQLLLADGSRQADLWGANYYPGRGEEECVEYTALINIRPAEGNRSMEIADESLRAKVREITFELVGCGEEDSWPSTAP